MQHFTSSQTKEKWTFGSLKAMLIPGKTFGKTKNSEKKSENLKNGIWTCDLAISVRRSNQLVICGF